MSFLASLQPDRMRRNGRRNKGRNILRPSPELRPSPRLRVFDGHSLQTLLPKP